MIMTSNIRTLSRSGESTDSQDDDGSDKRRENEEKESSLCPFVCDSFIIVPTRF